MEQIKVREIATEGGCVTVRFDVSEGLAAYFADARELRTDYNLDLSELPASVAVIPFVCNVLPIVWLTDATLELDSIDSDFYGHIDDIRGGYEAMYPMLHFGGRVEARPETPPCSAAGWTLSPRSTAISTNSPRSSPYGARTSLSTIPTAGPRCGRTPRTPRGNTGCGTCS